MRILGKIIFFRTISDEDDFDMKNIALDDRQSTMKEQPTSDARSGWGVG
jgi:hypothetical protein